MEKPILKVIIDYSPEGVRYIGNPIFKCISTAFSFPNTYIKGALFYDGEEDPRELIIKSHDEFRKLVNSVNGDGLVKAVFETYTTINYNSIW